MFRKLIILLSMLLVTVPAFAQSGSVVSGLTVNCDDGTSFSNGVEVIVVQMRSGYSYTATAVGLDGFDPVLAVLDTNTGNGLCNDDDANASDYSAYLPSTGRVRGSERSAQVNFDQTSSSTFADVSLVVGGYGNSTGEFLLFLEGMAVTANDGAGDAFSVNITPGMVRSGVPLTTYMITTDGSKVDPMIYQTAGGASTDVLLDSNGDQIYCDDAGVSNVCYNTETNLERYSVTFGGIELPGWEYDAMLTSDLSNIRLNTNRSNNYFTYYMTSPDTKVEGTYLLVFHVGIG